MGSDPGFTLYEKIWNAHQVAKGPGGRTLLYVDRHLLHDGSFHAFEALRNAGRKVRRPDAAFEAVEPVGEQIVRCRRNDSLSDCGKPAGAGRPQGDVGRTSGLIDEFAVYLGGDRPVRNGDGQHGDERIAAEDVDEDEAPNCLVNTSGRDQRETGDPAQAVRRTLSDGDAAPPHRFGKCESADRAEHDAEKGAKGGISDRYDRGATGGSQERGRQIGMDEGPEELRGQRPSSGVEDLASPEPSFPQAPPDPDDYRDEPSGARPRS